MSIFQREARSPSSSPHRLSTCTILAVMNAPLNSTAYSALSWNADSVRLPTSTPSLTYACSSKYFGVSMSVSSSRVDARKGQVSVPSHAGT